MSWFSKEKHSQVWKDYLESFQHSKPDFSEQRWVVFDTETTGLDPEKDRILSIGAVGIVNQKIVLNDSFECFLKQETFSRETVEIHGIRKSSANKIDEKNGIEEFLSFLKNAVLVGHHVQFDLTMMNKALSRWKLPKLKNTTLDTGNLHLKTFVDLPKKRHFTLDELSAYYKVPMHDRHTASGDAYLTAQIFLKILKKLEKNNPLSLSYLKRSAERTGLL